jgi:ferredoxin, 2Fe-2S
LNHRPQEHKSRVNRRREIASTPADPVEAKALESHSQLPYRARAASGGLACASAFRARTNRRPIPETGRLNSANVMARITFIQKDGTERVVEAEPGMTVMEAAVKNSISGIAAECGGACACATCHVYVDDAWRAATGAPEQMEEDMLDFAFDVRPSSRLSCQIKVSDALDGLVVRIPDKQF